MNIHKILQIVLQRFPSLPSPSICALDAFGLPVCPVDSLAIKSKSKGVRQIAPNQHLVRLPPAPPKNITKKSLRGRGFPCPLSQHHNVQSQQKESDGATLALKWRFPHTQFATERELFSPSESSSACLDLEISLSTGKRGRGHQHSVL